MSSYLYGFVVGIIPALAVGVVMLLKRSFDDVCWD